MSSKLELICRLCLNVVTNEFVKIDEVMRQMFDILSLKLDLNKTSDPIICWDCVEVAKKCLQFKSTIFTTERIILLFSTGRENAEHNIKVIYKETEKVETIFDDNLHICRICMTRLEGNEFASLDTLRNKLIMFDMLAEFMLEMDFNIIENPLICTTCTEDLDAYFQFTVNCLNTEGRITAYCNEMGNKNMGPINLGNIPHFLLKNVLGQPEKYSQIRGIQEEINMSGNTKCVYLEACNDSIKLEELDIKEDNLKETYYKDLPVIGIGNSTKSDTSSKTREYITKMCTYSKKSSLCAYEIKQKSSHKKLMLVHKDVSEVDMHKCSMCTYETKDKGNLQKHIFVHKDVCEADMHKCSMCTYKNKHRRNLKSHMLVHKDIYEVNMHKCSMCTYETKYDSCLRKHMLVHKDVSEIDMYKCSMCTYETKYKHCLKKHMLVHTDISEIDMYKCSMCTYATKDKSLLKKHILIHKDVSEIDMHRCSMCTFETKYKRCLKRHIFIHNDVSEIDMHKCSLCTYKTKHERNLKRHVFKHEDNSEIKMYKCFLCGHETKEKSSLKKHMLVHKAISEINMHKCSMCRYETKYKSSLKKHILVHKVSTCQTKHKRSLKKHVSS